MHDASSSLPSLRCLAAGIACSRHARRHSASRRSTLVRPALGEQRRDLDGDRKRLLQGAGTGRRLPRVPLGHHRIPDLPDRPGRHRDDRRPAERAVLLPRQPGRVPDLRRDRARRQGLRRDRAQGHQHAEGPRRQDRRHARRLDRLLVHLGIPVEERRRSEEASRSRTSTPSCCRRRCATAISPRSSSGSRSARARSKSARTRRTSSTDATGYIQGYLVAGARPELLNSADGPTRVTRFLRAIIKGRRSAESDFKAVAAYAAKLQPAARRRRATSGTPTSGRSRSTRCTTRTSAASRWAQGGEADRGSRSTSRKLTWPNGLRAIDPKLVDAPPPPC